LRSQADGGPLERRRERVQLRMKKDAARWKIIAMAPISILDPIHIQ
jgi:ketosteroid isomerase-like protein